MAATLKPLLVAATTLGIVAAGLFSGHWWFPTYADAFAPYPKEWFQVKIGMTSTEARKLVGEPWADGRNLKTLDRWFLTQNCVELRLDLWFGGPENEDQNDETSVVTHVDIWRKPTPPWRSRP